MVVSLSAPTVQNIGRELRKFSTSPPPKNDCGGEFTRRRLEGGGDPSTNQERSLCVSINTNNPPQRHVLQGEQLKVEHVFCALIIERERGGGEGKCAPICHHIG